MATSNEEVVFDAGSLTASLVHPTVDEALNDGNSAVWAVIRLGQYSIRPYPGEAVAWVRDDDIPTVTMTPETGEVFENPPNGTEFTVVRTGDTTNWLRLAVVTWHDRRWPAEVLEPVGAAANERHRTPNTRHGAGVEDFGPGEANNTFGQEPRYTGPLGTTSYFEVLPRYCGDDIPGDCGYRPQYKVGTPKSSTIEVLNRDMGVRVVADQASVDEGDSASFTLHRYGGTFTARVSSLTVRVQVTQNGEFIKGVPPQTVTFTGETVDSSTGDVDLTSMEGDTTAVVTIQTTNDMVDEANGAITLTILDPDPELYGSNAHSYEVFGTGTFLENSGWTNVATVEVLDDDVAGFSIADASADEADGSMQFTVTLPGSTFETSVDWATKDDAAGDDPATEGKDYAAASGTLTFAPGDTSKTFNVTLNDDDVKEKDETFTIQLTNPGNAALTDATAIGTIDDDDLSQAVFITLDVGTADGVEEGEDVVFNLERHTWLDGSPSQEVARGRLVVGLEIALEGDFVREPVPATAVFEAGVWVATVTVPTIDDAQFEPAGSVSLKLESQGFGLLSNADPVEADVYDNDMPVSIADAEGDEGDGVLTFTISLQQPAVIPVTVDVATVDGTATSHGVFTITDFGKDFEAKIETLTFAAGEQDKQFAVTLVDDRWDEAVESFTVELRNPSYARLQDASATGTILDNDPHMVATLVAPAHKRIDEDTSHPVRFEVQLVSSSTWASERSAYLNWTVTPDTATHGEDYVEAGGSIIIPPGHLTGTFDIHLVDDDLFETKHESFTVTLTRERWVLVDSDNNSKNIKIKDDDVLSAAVAAVAANVVEGSDATFNIRVSGSQHTEDVVVKYETGGTATSGDDYTAPSGTVTIPVGTQSVPIDIGTTADSLHDPNETLVVTLTDVTSVGRMVRSKAGTATVTILDQGTPVVSVEAGEGTEGKVLQFTVTLSSTTDAPVEVQWETKQYDQSLLGLDERATPGVDYDSGGGTVTILPGEDSGTILVTTTQDNLAENTERFLVKLTGASRVPATGDSENVALGAFSAEGSILDDDVAPTGVTLSATPVAVPEGAGQTELAITATLNTTTALAEDVSVLVTVAGGTATEGEDYTAATVTLIIAAGDQSRTGVLQLTPLDDEIAEGDETVQVTGTTEGLDVIPTEVTIADNDAEPTSITLRVTPNSVGEEDRDTVLNVKAVLAGGDRLPVDTAVTLSVEGVALPAQEGGTTSAASADDFSFSPVLPEGSEEPPGQIIVVIPAGESDATAQLTLIPVDDLIAEGDETAQVGGTADGLPVTAAPLTITDNDRDPTGIQLSVTPWDLVEGEGSPVLLVTATLTGGQARTADTQVSLSVHGLSAVAGEDYTAPSNLTLTIPAESLTGSTTMTLTLLDDDISENNEDLEVRGTNADPGLPVNGALVAIDDNDAAPTGVTLTLDKDQVPEDAGLQHLTVTGKLTGGGKRSVDTTVTLTVSSVTATDADYTYLPAGLTIQSGQAEGAGTLLLVPTDDLIDEDDEILEVGGVIRDPGLTVSAQQVVITDNDSAGVTITPTSLTVLERRGNSYAVRLNTQPTADVTVAISGHAGTALTLSSTTLASDSLTFTSSNWNTPQTVTVTAGAVTADTDVTLVHGVSGGDYGSVTAADVVVTVVDVPENQVTIQVGVSVSQETLAVPEGGSNTYDVVLGHLPTGDVTVTVTVDDTANNDVTTAEESLVFTTANWNEPKTVTVRAAEDDDALTDSDVTISHTVSGANYEGVAAPGLTVSITEKDTAGVTIDATSLTVTEGDDTGVSYTVKLATQPAGDVTVTISGHSGTDLSISGTTLSGDDELTFTTANWATAQTVTVKAAEDDDAVTDADVILAHAISSDDDTVYDALADQSVTVSITEDDAIGVTISPTTLTVTEGDATGKSYTVVLATQPAGDVKVTVSGHSGTDLTLSGTGLSNDNKLTFTTANWATAQTVKVTAAEDDDAVTDPQVTLTHAISSDDDSTYNALAGQSVTVSITDNDGLVTIAADTTPITEGASAAFTLTRQGNTSPALTVNMAVSQQGDYISGTAPATVSFGAGEATASLSVATVDDRVDEDNGSITATLQSGTGYTAGTQGSAAVMVEDNDTAGVTIDPTTLTVTEGDDTGVSYTVKLATQPAGDVTVTISGHSGTDLTLSGTGLSNDNKLTFTTGNWATAQTVTVKAAEDDDAVTDADVTLAHAMGSTADTVYNALAGQSVTVSITENDAAGVTINPTSLTITEGDATGKSYTVVLATQPAGDVKVTVSGHSGTDLTLSGTGLSNDNKLTFTTANWATAQTVKVTAAEDDDAVTDPQVTLTHAISSDDDSTYNALAGQSVTVSITDNDGLVTIAADTTPITEGASAAFTLTRQGNTSPALTVNMAVSQQGDYISGTAPATVSFGAGEATASLSVATVDDRVDEDNGSITATLQSGTGYTAGTQGSAAVMVEDNDTAGVTIDPTTLTVTEGDDTGVSYTVKLATQPAGDVTVTISGHSGTDLTLSGTGLSNDNKLTFTTGNWATAQTVTVKAAEDDDAVTDADVTLAHAMGSTADTVYNALAGQSVTVSITENDAAGVTINPTSLTITEGDATGKSYTVVLATQPAGDVKVTVSGHSGTDLTLSGTGLSNDNKLTFTTANWATAQTVKVTAAEDDDAVTDPQVTLTHAISSDDDSTYNALAGQSVTVSITENDAVGPTVTVSFEKEVHYTIEGASGAAGVEVLLSAPLQTEVIIPITVLSTSTADPEDYLVDDSPGYASDPGLTFSPGETFGYIFIEAVLDAVDEGTEAVVLGFGTLPEGVTEGSPNRSTVEISDAIQVSFADATYRVEEGGPGVEVMVRLNKPSNNLKVPLTADGQGGADSSDFTGVPQAIVFEDSETEKTFTFVAMEDSEEENGEMVILGFGAFSEGMVAVFPDSAMVMIDEDAVAPAPRHFAALWPTQTSITLTWFTVETAAEYKLEYRKQGESEWTGLGGDFDHLPSTSDHRDAFGVAAGLDCGTYYDFRVSARGSGDTRNDGIRYDSGSFGPYATISASTGECAQEERITNLLVSIEPDCATLTWTPPSGDRDTGYRVERYSYTDNRSQRSEPVTLVEQANSVDDMYKDCSKEYRTAGAEHVYIVTALDNNPEPDEEGSFGTSYTAILVYGPSWDPEGPLNVRLTHDTQSSRGLAWNEPRDRWLSTVKTARAGARLQQVTLDPWVTGYRVERREYRRMEGGGWVLQGDWETLRDETDANTGISFTDGEDKGDKQYVYRVWAHNDWGISRYCFRGDWAFNGGDPGGNPEPAQQGSEALSNTPATGAPAISGTPQVGETLTALTSGIADQDGLSNVSYSYQWTAGGLDIDSNGTRDLAGEDSPTYTPAAGLEGYTIMVRVTFTDDEGHTESLTSVPTTAVIAAATNTEPTGLPTISGTPQVGETLTADTSAIDDADGLTKVAYRYQWVAHDGTADTDLQDATASTYTPSAGDVGKTIKVKVSFTDDSGNEESLTSAATGEVESRPNLPATGGPAISGTPQDGETLTASTAAIADGNGLDDVSYQYQWSASGSDIDGATGSSLTLTSDQEGDTVQVRVTFTDDDGFSETLTSVATEAVAAAPAAANNPPTGLPTIGGTPQVEATLTADTANIADQDGLANVSYGYQWIAGGSDIAGATGRTYTLTSSEQGQTIQVKVTFTDDDGNEESLTSAATDAVTAKPIPLTATLSNAPASHDGSSTFTFDLAFSENVRAGYARIRNHAFTIDEGGIEKAQRKVQGSNRTWTITVEPDGNGDIVITLPSTTNCSSQRGICTYDDRMLSHPTTITVAGPGQ